MILPWLKFIHGVPTAKRLVLQLVLRLQPSPASSCSPVSSLTRLPAKMNYACQQHLCCKKKKSSSFYVPPPSSFIFALQPKSTSLAWKKKKKKKLSARTLCFVPLGRNRRGGSHATHSGAKKKMKQLQRGRLGAARRRSGSCESAKALQSERRGSF